MSLDRSLKMGNSLAQHRSVLNRNERIAKMKDVGNFPDGRSPLGLPKVKSPKAVVAKKKAKKVEEGAEAVAGVPGAPGGGAAAATPAAGSGGSSAKGGAAGAKGAAPATASGSKSGGKK